ncbi:MAG: hypothetical protein ACI8V4_001262 [Ilumatobacter sp.]|jgi:hypothetical protein
MTRRAKERTASSWSGERESDYMNLTGYITATKYTIPSVERPTRLSAKTAPRPAHDHANLSTRRAVGAAHNGSAVIRPSEPGIGAERHPGRTTRPAYTRSTASTVSRSRSCFSLSKREADTTSVAAADFATIAPSRFGVRTSNRSLASSTITGSARLTACVAHGA